MTTTSNIRSLAETPVAGTRGAVLALAAASLAMSVDPSVHNIAFVGAANDLGMTGDQRSLVASIGTLCIAASILATGSLGDRLGRKKIMLGGLLIATIASVVTASAQNTVLFTVGRILAGVGYAASFGLAFALLRAVAPGEGQLSRAVAQWLALQTLGVVVLGLLGGYLAGVGWRIAYLLPGVIASVSILFCMFAVPEARADDVGPFDAIGLTLVALGLVSTLYGVSNSASAGWSSGTVVIPLGVGVALLLAFAMYELRQQRPAFPIRLFADPEMAVAGLTGVAFNIGNAIIVLQLSLLWQYLYRYSPFQVSLYLMPFSVASILGASWVGTLLARGVANRVLIPAGLFAVAASIVFMSFASASTPYIAFLAPLLLAGVGLMFAQTPAARLFVSKSPPNLVGALGSSRTFFGQFGFALGLALSSSILYGLLGPGLRSRLVRAGAAPAELAQATGIVESYIHVGSARGFNPQIVYQVLDQARAAYLSSYRVMMLVMAAIIALMATFIFWRLSGAAKHVSTRY
jgi:MFS family permease